MTIKKRLKNLKNQNNQIKMNSLLRTRLKERKKQLKESLLTKQISKKRLELKKRLLLKSRESTLFNIVRQFALFLN